MVRARKERGYGNRAQKTARRRRTRREPPRQAPRLASNRGYLAAGDLLPAEARGARKSARMVRSLSEGRLYDGNRVLARTGRRTHRIHHPASAERRLSAPIA